MTTPLHQWPLTERPREKLLSQGATALSDAELLAIFFRTGIKGKSALDLARDALSKFGSLRRLLELDPQQFCQTRGLGLTKYIALQAALEIAHRHLYERLKLQDVIRNPTDTQQYLTARLRHHPHEIFACLFLDSQHYIICFEQLFAGTINNTTIHLRTLIKRIIHHNAASLIIAHNHPSGSTQPSEADKEITAQLQHLLSMLDVRLLDHIIVGEDNAFSFCENGLL